MNRARRLLALISLSFVAVLVAAPAAPAADGLGLYGPTDDKVVTFFAFGVMIFFALLVIVLSLIQGRLEGRKDRTRDELERLRRP